MSDRDQIRQTLDNLKKVLENTQYSDAKSFNTVSGTITVGIDSELGMGGPGMNLKSKTPNIVVLINETEVLRFTWDEARNFCSILTHVTDVAEFG